jgi:hypothetical protein
VIIDRPLSGGARLSATSLSILSTASNVAMNFPAYWICGASILAEICLASVDILISANGESAEKPVIEIRAALELKEMITPTEAELRRLAESSKKPAVNWRRS